MSDHGERSTQVIRDQLDVGLIVVDRCGREFAAAGATAVTTKTQRVRSETVLGEIRQEVIVPAPGGDKRAVHEK
ncbi:MAG: hypothetical protein JWN94_1040 [Betaproteobacteria bacterium]|nr:hypothetical protein [Betaproteobacteria bacterium]